MGLRRQQFDAARLAPASPIVLRHAVPWCGSAFLSITHNPCPLVARSGAIYLYCNFPVHVVCHGIFDHHLREERLSRQHVEQGWCDTGLLAGRKDDSRTQFHCANEKDSYKTRFCLPLPRGSREDKPMRIVACTTKSIV